MRRKSKHTQRAYREDVMSFVHFLEIAWPKDATRLLSVSIKDVLAFRDEMLRMCDIFRGRIIDVADGSYTIEMTGSGSKLDAFLETLDKTAILETVRTGASGIGRGDRILKV